MCVRPVLANFQKGSKMIRIDYCGQVENSARFLLYAFRICDRFSLTFQTRKP